MQVMTKRRSLNRIAPHLLALVVFVYLIAPQLTIGQSETLTLTEIRVDDQVLDLGPNLCFDFDGNVGLENQNNSFSVTLKSTGGNSALIDDDHLIWSISGSSFCVQFKPVGFDLNQFQQISVDTSVTTNLPNPLIAVLNNPPTFSGDSVSRSVEENTAPNSNVGAAITATDINEDTLTYSLAGTDQSFFDIDSSTGVLKVGENTILDYETRSTYEVIVQVTDSKANITGTADNSIDDTVAVTINLIDVDELTITDAAASEGDSITFTVTLDNAVAGGFKVTPGFTDGSAANNSDYTANTDAITFAGTAGETQTFTVDTTEDT
ncbi:MAG: cadherin repeat domain-containing protein, partial [Gammaproteobacteria bacterium]|nr:cadherin repeat domain-containing protein [Gammaproteobacteria bacterium]